MEKTSMTRKRVLRNLLLMTLLLVSFVYVGLGKESMIEDFPVPLYANYIDDGNPKDMKYSTTGIFYSLTLRLNGWKEDYHEGELKAFNKNNRQVIVIQPTGKNTLYLYENEK